MSQIARRPHQRSTLWRDAPLRVPPVEASATANKQTHSAQWHSGTRRQAVRTRSALTTCTSLEDVSRAAAGALHGCNTRACSTSCMAVPIAGAAWCSRWDLARQARQTILSSDGSQRTRLAGRVAADSPALCTDKRHESERALQNRQKAYTLTRPLPQESHEAASEHVTHEKSQATASKASRS
jgi:hypothetical protein